MSLLDNPLAVAVAVVLIVVAVMVYNALAAARPKRPASGSASAPGGAGSEVALPRWTGRYLQFEGDVVGRVVAVEGERVYVQKGASYLCVPRARVREQGLDLGLVGEFDAAAAAAEAAGWAPPTA